MCSGRSQGSHGRVVPASLAVRLATARASSSKWQADVAAQLAPTACEWLVDRNLALYSINNTPHIILFALFFLLARRQVRVLGPGHRAWWGVNVRAFTTTLAMGVLVELAEASAGAGHCRLRDLLPDAVGAMLGWTVSAVAMAAWGRWWPELRRLRGRSNSSGGVT